MESTYINDDRALPWMVVLWDAWLAAGPKSSRGKDEDGREESSLRSGTNARYRHESERLLQHVSLRSFFNQHGGHNAEAPYREQYPHVGSRLSHPFFRDRQVLQACDASTGGGGDVAARSGAVDVVDGVASCVGVAAITRAWIMGR